MTIISRTPSHPIYGAYSTLTAWSFSINAKDNRQFFLSLSADSTLTSITNWLESYHLEIILVQDATGARTFTPPWSYVTEGAVNPTPNSVTILLLRKVGTTVYATYVDGNWPKREESQITIEWWALNSWAVMPDFGNSALAESERFITVAQESGKTQLVIETGTIYLKWDSRVLWQGDVVIELGTNSGTFTSLYTFTLPQGTSSLVNQTINVTQSLPFNFAIRINSSPENSIWASISLFTYTY